MALDDVPQGVPVGSVMGMDPLAKLPHFYHTLTWKVAKSRGLTKNDQSRLTSFAGMLFGVGPRLVPIGPMESVRKDCAMKWERP